MSAKSDLHQLVDSLSEDEARQALDELRVLVARNGASGRGDAVPSEPAEAEEVVHEVTVEEGRALFDQAARFYTGLSGEDFLKKWDADELDRNDPRIVHVAMLIPFARAE